MAEKRELKLKSLEMLSQYPKAANLKTNTDRYEDYRKLHSSFIRAYKQLYGDVAAFSILPEQFINQAEPVIEKYLENYNLTQGNGQKEWLQVITDFISRFYDFMDEATEMFAEHQSLADETFTFLQNLAELEKKYKGPKSLQFQNECIQLIPELQHLANSLKVVREAVDITASHLESLEPVWEKIKSKIN